MDEEEDLPHVGTGLRQQRGDLRKLRYVADEVEQVRPEQAVPPVRTRIGYGRPKPATWVMAVSLA
jgi:hypothetical protein